MKILLLSDSNSEHTEKWALSLAEKGIKIGLFSFNKSSYEWHSHPNITVFFEPPQKINAESTLTKLSYLKYVSIIRKISRHFEPDLIHAHYATSYGLLGALSNFHPFVLSVWGSDVYDFPKRSRVHKKVFQYNLSKADLILSTSEVMKIELQKYTQDNIIVTPFGVDIKEFAPKTVPDKDPNIVYVGTIKPIEEKYGISDIIDAAKLVVQKMPQKQFRFYLVGTGPDMEKYRQTIIDKGLAEHFVMTDRVPFSEVAHYHNLLDIFLNVSINDSESFGVATVEAMSCEKPVIVTEVGGLMEVVDHGKFGTVIPKGDPSAMAEAILKIVEQPRAFAEQAKLARQHVLAHYNWENNLLTMIQQYELLLANQKKSKSK